MGRRLREARAAVLLALADDRRLARVRGRLVDDGRFTITAEAEDAASAIGAAAREQPDLCVLDVALAGGGIAAAWEINARLPEATIVMLTDAPTESDLFASLRAGAVGLLPTTMKPERLPDALADALAGGAPIPRTLVSRLAAEFRDQGPRRRTLVNSHGTPLTSREWQVLELLGRGHSTAEIAERLYISKETVRSHIAALIRKLGAADRAAAVRLFQGREDR